MEKDKFECVVKEFGNGAHITVPKELIGTIVTVETVGPMTPPPFKGFEEGREVVLDISSGESLSGEIVEFDITISDDGHRMTTQAIIDTGHNFYRMQVSRKAGDDGWPNEYSVEKSLTTDEVQSRNDVIALDSNGTWGTEGTLESVAVKQNV